MQLDGSQHTPKFTSSLQEELTDLSTATATASTPAPEHDDRSDRLCAHVHAMLKLEEFPTLRQKPCPEPEVGDFLIGSTRRASNE